MTGCSSACGQACCDPCCSLQAPNWFDPSCQGPTIAAFVTGEGWRDASELSWPNNFGNRIGLDSTWNLADTGVRASLGFAYGMYDYHGRFILDDASTEQQIFLTGGLYHRASGRNHDVWTWAVSYDYLNDNHYGLLADSVGLHQTRYLVGHMFGTNDELGVWGSVGLADDSLTSLGIDPKVDAQDQVNLYWRHYYQLGGETMLYAGLAQPNLTVNAPAPFARNTNDNLREFVIGMRGLAPLTNCLALFGGMHYVVPTAQAGNGAMDQENWNIGIGLMWIRGCNLPVLPVADNGWFGKRLVRSGH